MTDHSNIIRDHLFTDGLLFLSGSPDNPYPRDELNLSITADDVYLDASYRISVSDGIPFHVWHGRTRQWTLATGPCIVNVDSLREDLADGGRLSILIDRIQTGLTEYWDGSNMRGKLDEDAAEAESELEQALHMGHFQYGDENWQVWHEDEWISAFDKSTIKADWSNEQIDAYLEDGRQSARADNVWLLGDAREYLIEYRDELREKAS